VIVTLPPLASASGGSVQLVAPAPGATIVAPPKLGVRSSWAATWSHSLTHIWLLGVLAGISTLPMTMRMSSRPDSAASMAWRACRSLEETWTAVFVAA
jgi:hypothetical protein